MGLRAILARINFGSIGLFSGIFYPIYSVFIGRSLNGNFIYFLRLRRLHKAADTCYKGQRL